MSTSTPKVLLVLLAVALAFGSTFVQLTLAQSRASADAAATARTDERERSAARWEAAVEAAREAVAPVRMAAQGAAEAVGDLASPADAVELADAVAALDEATAGRDIGAIAARRNDVVAALTAFRASLAANAESVLAANPSADASTKTAMTAAITSVHANDDEASITGAAFAGLRSAADRLVASHQANVAAAAAAAAAAAEAAAAAAAAADAATRSTGSADRSSSATQPDSPLLEGGWVNRSPPTIEAFGDYRPGCEVIFGEWDWWYENPPGYVAIDPGYPYDIEVMEFEGRYAGVKSLPCVT